MEREKEEQSPALRLRTRAEALVSGKWSSRKSAREEMSTIIRELLSHQAELEVQNKKLCRAQRELESARNRHFSLSGTATVPYLTMDEDGLIVDANDRASAMLGAGQRGLAGNAFAQFVFEDDKPVYRAHIEQMVSSCAITSCELRLTKTDGEILSAYLECIPREDAEGRVTGFSAAVFEITHDNTVQAQPLDEVNHFRALAENAPDFIAYFDRDLRYLYVNPSVEAISGRSRRDFIGRTSREMGIPEAIRTVLDNALRETFSRGASTSLEFEALSARGPRTYHVQIFPGISRTGAIGYVMCIGRDISEHKQMEEALKKVNEQLETRVRERTLQLMRSNEMLKRKNLDQSRAKEELRVQGELLRTIIDNIPAMICLDDPHGRTRMINRSLEYITGWNLEDARQDDFLARLYTDGDLLRRAVEQWDREGPHWVDLRIRTKDGRDLPSAWSRVRLSNNDMIFIGIDLTERVREEQERVLLAAAIEQSMDAMAIADVNGKIQYVNPAFESLNSCSREKVMGVDIASVLASDRRQKWVKGEIHGAIAGGGQWKGLLQRKGGEGKIELDTTITPLRDSRGAIADYLIIERDVTRERELERHLAASRKMEIIGTLAGGIAHDLNNILNPVLISAEAVMAEIPEDSPLRPDIRIILEAGIRGKDLVRQILSFASGQEGRRRAIRLGSLVREPLSLLRSTLPAAIEVRTVIPDMDDTVVVDPTQIQQVMMNLYSNAAQAIGGRGGVIEIRMDHKDIDAADAGRITDLKPGRYFRITVRDTGTGMSKRVLDNLFTPFFTTKKQGEGTGLGLSFSRRIIRNHGGTITVASKPGEGSSFQVYLPRAHLEDQGAGR